MDSTIERNHELFIASQVESGVVAPALEPNEHQAPYDWQTEEQMSPEEYVEMIWGFITPDHARRIGVSEVEISKQLNQ